MRNNSIDHSNLVALVNEIVAESGTMHAHLINNLDQLSNKFGKLLVHHHVVIE